MKYIFEVSKPSEYGMKRYKCKLDPSGQQEGDIEKYGGGYKVIGSILDYNFGTGDNIKFAISEISRVIDGSLSRYVLGDDSNLYSLVIHEDGVALMEDIPNEHRTTNKSRIEVVHEKGQRMLTDQFLTMLKEFDEFIEENR